MEYNTTRNNLIIPEYGRNVQKMVEYAKTIADKNERTRFSFLIVSVMGQINPQGVSGGDHQHKLWDHLQVIAEFNLDVDAPYEKPEPNILHAKPEKVEYSNNNIAYRHYGKNIMRIIDKAAAMDEGSDKEEVARMIATHLKKSYLTWNRESVNDELIADQLAELSDGKLSIPEGTVLASTSEILATQKKPKTPKTQNKSRDKGKSYRKNPRY